MKAFEVWFRDLFLYPLLPQKGKREKIEEEKEEIYIRWLFGSSLYISGFCFCLWVIGMNSIHFSSHLKDKLWIEKIFFFTTPSVWKNYLLRYGGLFNIFRNSSGIGENVFISSNLGIIFFSFINLAISLILINISCKKECRKLRLVTYPLCFPALGCIASALMIIYMQFLRDKPFHEESIFIRKNMDRYIKKDKKLDSRFFSESMNKLEEYALKN